MANKPIISVSGLRGIVGDSLPPELAIRFACSFAALLPAGPIVLGRDGRATGRMFADLIRGGLCAMGRTVIDADVAATPTIGLLVRHLKAAGGVQITASHNPPPYNGLKLFRGEGRVLTAEQGNEVITAFERDEPVWVAHDEIGSVEISEDPHGPHLEKLLSMVDVERIRSRGFRILLDSNCGSGAALGRRLLEALGCELTILGEEPCGMFIHEAEPTAENLVSVGAEVTDRGAVLGFCQDPDADRLAIIDGQGQYLGEEYTLALCLDHVLRSNSGAAVANCATSRMSQEVTEKHGGKFYRSAVGEANVVDLMLSEQAVFGGEGNGGPIDPRVGYIRDSFVGMALVLDAMAAREMSVRQLADELPRFEIHKTKVPLAADKIAAALDALESHFSEATADRCDGLRLDWPGKWLLVRASNTEPIVRAIAEASTLEEAKQLCAAAADILANC